MHLEENDNGSTGAFAVRAVQLIAIGRGFAVILFLNMREAVHSLIHE